jgi:hypothetical protein
VPGQNPGGRQNVVVGLQGSPHLMLHITHQSSNTTLQAVPVPAQDRIQSPKASSAGNSVAESVHRFDTRGLAFKRCLLNQQQAGARGLLPQTITSFSDGCIKFKSDASDRDRDARS